MERLTIKNDDSTYSALTNGYEEGFTDDEKFFLIGCILMSAEEGFYYFNRNKLLPNFSDDNVLSLFKKLGASEDQVKELKDI